MLGILMRVRQLCVIVSSYCQNTRGNGGTTGEKIDKKKPWK